MTTPSDATPPQVPAAGSPYAAPAVTGPAPMQGWTPPTAPVVPAGSPGRPLAGFGARLGAYLLDALIAGTVITVIVCPLTVGAFAVLGARLDTGPEPSDMAVVIGALAYYAFMFLIAFGVYYLYFVEYQLRAGGQTLGKRALRIAVVPQAPVALTRRALALRWTVQFVAGGLVPLFVYIDGLWQLWDKPWQQCLHDKAAGTVVVEVR